MQSVVEVRGRVIELNVPGPFSLPVHSDGGVDRVPNIPVLGVSVNVDSRTSKRRRRLNTQDMRVNAGLSQRRSKHEESLNISTPYFHRMLKERCAM